MPLKKVPIIGPNDYSPHHERPPEKGPHMIRAVVGFKGGRS
jgi:hypothetical protein